jgi:Ser/Thr protein kinase RdoA (MazF antagonist)
MTRCAGVPLDALVRQWRTSRGRNRADLLAAIASVGAWLRAFQSLGTESVTQDNPIHELRHQVERDLQVCLSRRLLRGDAAGVVRQMEALIERLVPASRRAVLRHGDLWPGNVFADAAGVQVVDFEATRVGMPWEDAAYFLLHLELYFVLRSRSMREHIRGAFLDAFCDGHVDSAALELATMAAALQSLAHGRRGREWSGHRFLTTIALRRVISRAAARASGEHPALAPAEVER